MRTVRLLLKVDWAAYVTAVTSCAGTVSHFLKQPAQASLAALSILNEDQMSNLQSQLGLSQRSMSTLLLTANVTVVAVYLLSTLVVILSLWPALCDLGRLVFRLSAAFTALARLFERVFGHPFARIAAHGLVYAKCLYVVAAGSIVAPAAPLAGVSLAVLGHVSATRLSAANWNASADMSEPVARTRPVLFFAVAMASSAVCHQNLLVGAVTVAAVHYATAAWSAARECTSDETFWASTLTSLAVLGLSLGARLYDAPVSWYAPFNLGVATISKHTLLFTGLMHTAEGSSSKWRQRLDLNLLFLLECLCIGGLSHLLSLVDLGNTVWIYFNIWAAWKLVQETPEAAEGLGWFASSVLVCHGCWFMLTHPAMFKSVIAL